MSNDPGRNKCAELLRKLADQVEENDSVEAVLVNSVGESNPPAGMFLFGATPGEAARTITYLLGMLALDRRNLEHGHAQAVAAHREQNEPRIVRPNGVDPEKLKL